MEEISKIKNELIKSIISFVKKSISPSGMIILNETIYFSDDTYYDDRGISSISIAEDGEIQLYDDNVDTMYYLDDLNAERLEELFKAIEYNEYEIVE